MKRPVLAALAVLMFSMCLGFYGALRFAESERARDLQQVQSGMTIVADSRADALSSWLRDQYQVLAALSNNQSAQIYIGVLGMRDSDQRFDADPAERDYLRNLLTATAAQAGFIPERVSAPLPANVKPFSMAGLALLDPDGTVIAATEGMPPIRERLAQFLAATPPTAPGLLDIFLTSGGIPTIGFLVPVLGQERDATAVLIARALGVRPLDADFFARLRQPGAVTQTAETYLIRRSGAMIEYLTPLRDGSAPLAKRLAADTDGLLDAAALRQPGRFHSGRDYAANDAFAVSRPIADSDWVLVHRIDRAEALAQSDTRQTALIGIAGSLILLIGATLIAVWRYAASLRAEEAARQFKASSERFEALSRFLDVVTDSQPQPIFVTDTDGNLVFANRRMAEITGVPRAELPGRSLVGMLGQERGSQCNGINRQVLQTARPITRTWTFRDNAGHEQVWRSHHCRLEATPDRPAAVLTTIEDLTDLVRERKRREGNTQQLIDTLVGLVDERDPDSANQSRHVAELARRIAAEMGLPAILVDTAEQAARLANLGKIRIPRTLLRKAESLTDDERGQIQQAMDEGPGLLKEIEFEGPVVETLRQINEWVDGSGRPLGLKGDRILPTAQAVALANAFVALVSPRAFRGPKSFAETETLLLGEIDRRFSKQAVLGLLNFMNNQGGRDIWVARTSPTSI